jgi:hypothetical protein
MARLYAGAMDAADNAEKRLLALLRSQVPSANRAGRGTDTFVQEQNIAHYRALLQAGNLGPPTCGDQGTPGGRGSKVEWNAVYLEGTIIFTARADSGETRHESENPRKASDKGEIKNTAPAAVEGDPSQ